MTTQLLIHEVAVKINAANRFTQNRCKCKGKCNSTQCSCIKSQITWSNHCHPGSKCANGEVTSIQHVLTLQNPDGWLTNKHMTVVHTMLQQDYPMADGLQDTVLQQNFSWNLLTSQYVQFFHISGNHWITITNSNKGNTADVSTVYVYDSLAQPLSDKTKALIYQYHGSDKVSIKVMNVQRQENSSDCGSYAIAFAKSLLAGNDPTELCFINPRQYLIDHLPNGEIPNFPTRVMSSDVLQLSPPKKLSAQRKPQKLIPVPSDYESDYELIFSLSFNCWTE